MYRIIKGEVLDMSMIANSLLCSSENGIDKIVTVSEVFPRWMCLDTTTVKQSKVEIIHHGAAVCYYMYGYAMTDQNKRKV